MNNGGTVTGKWGFGTQIICIVIFFAAGYAEAVSEFTTPMWLCIAPWVLVVLIAFIEARDAWKKRKLSTNK